MKSSISISAPLAAAVVAIHVKAGDEVNPASTIAILESMKMQTTVTAQYTGTVLKVHLEPGATIQAQTLICDIELKAGDNIDSVEGSTVTAQSTSEPLIQLQQRLYNTSDEARQTAIAKRHTKGFRSARENLTDLVDDDSFVEYGQLAIAAQRGRRDHSELLTETAADGIITGLGQVNGSQFDQAHSKTAIVVDDYSVLAGTQGYFHHKKLDRILEVAHDRGLANR